LRENKSAPITSHNNSLSFEGIQYRILAVLNAQGPLFIGWGFKWETAVICTDAVRTVDLSHPDGQLCGRNSEIFTENLSCLRAASRR
jgi:hypothetical protein